ncbi:MAG: glycosyltransferase family protein [Deltaproteobacteria bacterium]|nr:glycosyltransferase family protein [Deltaproteobacteria bacterium]
MNQQRVVAIIQARMGSTRLPGKSMIRLRDKPIIELVLCRVRCAKTLTKVVLGTTNQPRDDVLCDIANSLHVQVFRGSEDDVLKRYILAAQTFGADVVVRVCADNPVIAPEEIDRIVMHHVRTGADYSFNHIPAMDNHYPDGLGAEVVNFGVLEAIDRQATDPYHREHVTAYIWDHLQDFHVETVVAPPDIAGPEIKLDVDTEADLVRLKMLFSEAPYDISTWGAVDIIRTYRRTFG